MRSVMIAIAMLFLPVFSFPAQAQSQLSIHISDRGVSLGFVVSSYPTMQRIPGYPVYYDPRADSNYFFYDGLYWVFQGDSWYSSTWYNGPWDRIPPAYVPAFILRVPVRYYRHPPAYFRGWSYDGPPRWGQHWGRDWERQRSGWNRWNRRSVPGPAPLPNYQRQYTGSRYPGRIEQQRSIETRNYRYRPREAVSRQIVEQRRRDARSRDLRQQQRQRNVQQQQQQRQRSVQQQQLQRQRSVQQQQQRQRNVQQQQQQQQRQRQDTQQQRQRNVQAQRNREAASRQPQRSRPASKSRGKDSKGTRGRSDKDGNRDRNDTPAGRQ